MFADILANSKKHERKIRAEGKAEGKVEGKAEGNQEGEQKKAIKMAKKMLAKNKPLDEIMEFTELTEDEIAEIELTGSLGETTK